MEATVTLWQLFACLSKGVAVKFRKETVSGIEGVVFWDIMLVDSTKSQEGDGRYILDNLQ